MSAFGAIDPIGMLSLRLSKPLTHMRMGLTALKVDLCCLVGALLRLTVLGNLRATSAKVFEVGLTAS